MNDDGPSKEQSEAARALSALGASKGGKARAAKLTPAERAEIARRGAAARWTSDVPRATHEGDFNIGDVTVSSAVLEDGRRVLTQSTFLVALGRSRTPKAGTGVLADVDRIPTFLDAAALKPYLSDELLTSTTPVYFTTGNGVKKVGYDATALPAVAEVYLKWRDDLHARGASVPGTHAHIVHACDLVMRGLARVGIIALVDEATGYQEIRDRRALQAILDQFLRKEFAAWAKRFPDEFYKEIFRLRGWTWRGMKVNRPHAVAHYTRDLVYARLLPGILTELEARNPRNERGHRAVKHHQFLTDEVGHPALAQHLYALIGFMKSSDTWDEFMTRINRAYPRRGDSLQLSLFEGHDPNVEP